MTSSKISQNVKLAIVIGCLGVFIATCCYYSTPNGFVPNDSSSTRSDGDTEVEFHLNNNPIRKPSGNDYFGMAREMLLQLMDPNRIEEFLKYLTTKGHMAGTKQDFEQAEYIRDTWLEQGMDSAHLHPYNVELSHPDLNKPNKVYLLDETGTIKFTSNILEDPWDGTPYDESIPPAFMAFSPAATITKNELVYVNYGLYEEFEQVESMGIQIEGRMVIARYGRIFRGDKVLNAQRFKAAGVILYTDPAEYHPSAEAGGESYPNSIWLPGSGIQRGSLMWRDGDPSTPLYPSIDGAYRHSEDEQEDIPKIPCHTLSYNDAKKILMNMGGQQVPEKWRGGLNITYKMGPQLAREGWSLRLEVNNVKRIVPTYNVIGMIRGSEEPDRYVILGNHRDSWSFGSCDPSSGTAVFMELSRAFGSMIQKGWRPRRSIVLISWGAGEYGFFGATEWIEEYLKVMQSRAVAYINVDLAVMVSYNLRITATPLLFKIIKEATKMVPAPDKTLGYATLWDHWTQRVRAASPDLLSWMLGSTSEQAPFYQRVGVPVVNMLWAHNHAEYNWTDYPLYHTTFEDFEAMKTFLDPDFQYHLSLGHLWGLIAIGLADAKVLPMDPYDEVLMLKKVLSNIKRDFGSFLERNGISLGHLESTINRFEQNVNEFNQNLQSKKNIPLIEARQINDQLMMLERCFIDEQGSPSRPHMKNYVFGTSIYNQYQGWEAPSLRESLLQATQCLESCMKSCASQLQLVEQQLAALQYVINSASLIIRTTEYL